jgi:mono/diheme cytochrome c family protein
MHAVNRLRTKAMGVALFGTALLILSGCDANENADTERGRELFIANCGTCHALAEAATTNTTGPNLDASFADARESGMDPDTIEGVVSRQIELPREVAPDNPTYMPADIVTGQDAEDVSAYVASVAGVPGIEPPTAAGGPGGQVYAANGCAACHTLAVAESTGQVGPDLDEVIPGQKTDYVREQIIDPSSDITAGYSDGIMPTNYESQIPAPDLDKLVNFLTTCAGEDPADVTLEADGSCSPK